MKGFLWYGQAGLRKDDRGRWNAQGRCNGTSKAMDGGFIVTVQKLYQGLVLNLRYTHLPP